MQKPKREKQKTQEDNNPFDDLFFWLTLVTADFSCDFEKSDEDATAPDTNDV